MATKDQIGFTSEDFYNRYINNSVNGKRTTEVTHSFGVQQQNYQNSNDYNAGSYSKSQYGNFTTASNAPRIVPGEYRDINYTIGTVGQAGGNIVGTSNDYQVERGYSVQGGSQQQYVNTQLGYSSGTSAQQNSQVVIGGKSQRQSNITRIKPPLAPSTNRVAMVNNDSRQLIQTTQVPGSTTIRTSQVKEGEVIKGQSRIEYIPFENKVIDYETREWIEKVPVQKKIIQYEEKRTYEQVPREVTKTDYYAVEYIKEYVPQVVPERIIEMVQVEKVVNKTHYVPIQTQIIHNPDGTKVQGQSRILYQPQDTMPAGMVQGQSNIHFQTEGIQQIQGQSRITVQPTQNIVPQSVRGQSRIIMQQPLYQTVNIPNEQVYYTQQAQQQLITQPSTISHQEFSNYYALPGVQGNIQPVEISSRIVNPSVGGTYIVDNSQSQMVLTQAPGGMYQQVLIPAGNQQQSYPQQEVFYQQVVGTPQVYAQPQEIYQSVRVAQPQQYYQEQQQVIYQQQPQYIQQQQPQYIQQQSQYVQQPQYIQVQQQPQYIQQQSRYVQQQPQYVQQQYISEPQVYSGQIIQQGPSQVSTDSYQNAGQSSRYTAAVDKYISNLERQYRK